MDNRRKPGRIAVSVVLAVGVTAVGFARSRHASSVAAETEIGGSISVLGVLSGDNLEAFLSAFAPFEEETGISIEYEGTFDLLAVLQTRLDGGNPPDIVSNPSAGQMQTLANDGELLALDDIVDVAAVEADFPASLVELSTVGDDHFGIPGTTAVAGLVWYNPTQYDGTDRRHAHRPR